MEDCLEYTQALLNQVAENAAINPIMNAVADGFTRRRLTGLFRAGHHGIELDTVLNADTVGFLDDDEKFSQRWGGNSRSRRNDRVCYLFQSDSCTWKQCRYSHTCSKCKSPNHGRANCPLASTTGNSQRESRAEQHSQRESRKDQQGPPHPRYRRDRARSMATSNGNRVNA